jgi:hypothetical protein
MRIHVLAVVENMGARGTTSSKFGPTRGDRSFDFIEPIHRIYSAIPAGRPPSWLWPARRGGSPL